jgi:hypothetical protein
MTTTLDEKEVVRAMEVYLALKGFKTDGGYKFGMNKENGAISITVNVEQQEISFEQIITYARNN